MLNQLPLADLRAALAATDNAAEEPKPEAVGICPDISMESGGAANSGVPVAPGGTGNTPPVSPSQGSNGGNGVYPIAGGGGGGRGGGPTGNTNPQGGSGGGAGGYRATGYGPSPLRG